MPNLCKDEDAERGWRASLRVMCDLEAPFIGSKALACGAVTRHQLRTRYRPVLPNVYLSARVHPCLQSRIAAAWLWSRGSATVGGAAAAALHGAKWIPEDVPVELICARSRPPRGVLTRRDVLIDGGTQ